ncbi:hypothetical protein Rumeso_04361 [Rubellimicrobium mesophilum DSM 19309]|uniref:CENP-V/GFA domain-containing protein n=1 Tax=Rubellimicrobium mesophilum DSM 19309 TaxID=442562 RepID=A0A017HJ03_9RHOB|nr:GFA family protein [Rubellimicrobium mesophilum]EYD74108.1 hypothetical protein Rumeso_04361 [Rubellimicrobium mesophilum DSM 19309]
MDGVRAKRGAWRRDPVLPRAMTARGGATVTADPTWAEARPEARRTPDRMAPGTPPLPEPEPDPGPAPQPVPDGPGPKPAEAVRLGGCLCGAVRYEARGEPRVVGLCHCEDCRKASGGLGLYYGDWPLGAVTVTGTLSTFRGRSFCPTCGSRVVHLSAHHAELLLGTLDDPPIGLVPQREGWIVRREPWMQPVAGAVQAERDPE